MNDPRLGLHVLILEFLSHITPQELVSGQIVSPKGHIGWSKGFHGVNPKIFRVEEVRFIRGRGIT